MRKITHFQTLDGQSFATEAEALTHLSRLYSAALNRLAQRMEGRTAETAYSTLDNSLENMQAIVDIHNDMKVESGG